MTSSPPPPPLPSGWPPPSDGWPPPPSPAATARGTTPTDAGADATPWSWGGILAPLGVLVGSLAVLIVAVVALAPLLSDSLAGAIAQVVSALAILLGGLWVWRGLDARVRDRVMQRRASVVKTLVLGIPFGLGLVALQVGVIMLGAAIDPGVRSALQDPDNRVDLNLPPVTLALTLVALVVLAPLGEELLFRGLLLRGLWSRMSFWWAAALSSLAFGLAHLDPWFTGLWPRSLALAGVGVGLCLIYRRWGYWAAVTAHATVNGLAAIALLAA